MKFRVAIFERKAGAQVFQKFAHAGFAIMPDGRLYRGKKECNTTDRRQRKYYEINYQLPKRDRLGNVIYEHDIIFDPAYGALSVVLWNESGCAFVLANKTRCFTVKYRYCTFRESVEVIGNEYEKQVKQISAQGLTR